MWWCKPVIPWSFRTNKISIVISQTHFRSKASLLFRNRRVHITFNVNCCWLRPPCAPYYSSFCTVLGFVARLEPCDRTAPSRLYRHIRLFDVLNSFSFQHHHIHHNINVKSCTNGCNNVWSSKKNNESTTQKCPPHQPNHEWLVKYQLQVRPPALCYTGKSMLIASLVLSQWMQIKI